MNCAQGDELTDVGLRRRLRVLEGSVLMCSGSIDSELARIAPLECSFSAVSLAGGCFEAEFKSMVFSTDFSRVKQVTDVSLLDWCGCCCCCCCCLWVVDIRCLSDKLCWFRIGE